MLLQGCVNFKVAGVYRIFTWRGDWAQALRNSRLNSSLKRKIIATCDAKIATKGVGVGVSFYAFFKNKNDDPELLMEAATWWIKTHQLDHFEKALKIKGMVEQGL